VKILHTADIHLKKVGDGRWNSLVSLIATAKIEGVDIFIVSGDLFDSSADAETIRAELRGLFSNNPFSILLLPGNHDQHVYTQGRYFGDDVVVMDDIDNPFRMDDTIFWALPFTSMDTENVFRQLRSFRKLLDDRMTHILLCHCELLDSFFSRRDFGDEGTGRYMPVRLSYFDGLDFTYILAGHFHTRFDIRALKNGGYFVYPGSPVSISSKETGRRKVALFEVGSSPEGKEVDTPYYEKVVITLDPSNGESPVATVAEILDRTDPNCTLLLTIDGYFNGDTLKTDETKLTEELQRLVRGKPVVFTPLYRDIQTILDDDLFTMFLEKLNGGNFDEDRKARLYKAALQAMMQAGIMK
jgi:exonuclease SbcD